MSSIICYEYFLCIYVHAVLSCFLIYLGVSVEDTPILLKNYAFKRHPHVEEKRTLHQFVKFFRHENEHYSDTNKMTKKPINTDFWQR